MRMLLRELSRQARDERFRQIQLIEHPVVLTLKPGSPDTPEIQEWLARVQAQINEHVKDPYSDFNRCLDEAVLEELS